jgi:hypothetical protein
MRNGPQFDRIIELVPDLAAAAALPGWRGLAAVV